MPETRLKPANTEQDLPRRLGLLDATCIVVGTVIGAGIFMVPGIVARNVPSASGILLVWIVGGILSYFGALAYAELGAAYPATGGQYVFLREAYGPGMAFVCGWTLWLVVMSGNLAAVAVSFTIYLGYFVPLSALQAKAAAVALIFVLTYLNYRGVRLGAAVQNTFTLLKLAGIAVLVGSAFFFRKAAPVHFLAPPAGLTLQGFGMALVASLVAYDGWSNLSFVNGEVVKPQRTLPRAVAIGVGVAMAVYLLANIAYLRVLTPAAIAGAARVGSDVAQQTMGAAGAAFLSVTVLISMLGACNGTVMTAPRLYFAQALDGLFFRRFAKVHPTYRTPSVSVVAQGVWGALLAATGSYELIINYAIFCAWAFYALVVIGLMILRRSQPDVPRPYRLWGYPLTPLLFAGVAVLVLVNSVITTPLPSLSGLGIILAGIPVYFYWRRQHAVKVAEARKVVA